MAHEKHRFVPKVDYITSPGYGNGAGWREKSGLPRGGPSAVITSYGVMKFDPYTKEMVLVSVHPGITVERVLENTGWPLIISDKLDNTQAPSDYELKLLSKLDPKGYWTK
jgi:glutaconate CoA-transferase, subunit B